MRLSEIKPIPALVDLLTNLGVTDIIYDGSEPTSKLPNSFIQILQNGSLKTGASQMGIVEGVLLVSINVKLLSTGIINTKKEDFILGKFDSLFTNNNTAVNGAYHFSLNPNNLVYGGRGISADYSTKLINLQVKIF